jgi:phage terminase large subunit GpA-like protein
MGEVPKGEVRTVSWQQIYFGGLLLFAGCDVQGDRLEMCVTAFGPDGNKWIVDYQIFYGQTENINDPCWQMLHDWVYFHEYRILGKPAFIEICAIDAGWSPDNKLGGGKRDKDYAGKTNIIYDFVAERIDKFIATMGDPSDKAIGILKESKISDVQTYLTKRYMVSVSLMKEIIMGVIEKSEGHNAIHVPKTRAISGVVKDIEDEFYKQFLSERYQEIKGKPGVYGWVKTRNRNEVLDTFIYSCAAAAFYGVDRWTNEQWAIYYYGLVG